MGIRKAKMIGCHDIVTAGGGVPYLNNVTGIYCFCSALGFSECRRYKRRYIKTSLVDEILASAIQPYGIRHCPRTIWYLRIFMYALDSQISLYHMDQSTPFADSMPRSASIDTMYMEECSALSSRKDRSVKISLEIVNVLYCRELRE